MTDIPYNYHKYIDDVTKMRQRGAISSGEQIASPSSAGSRGLAKTTQFTKNSTQMKMGQNEGMTPLAESMTEIRNTLNRIDGVNVPVQEEPTNEGPTQDQAKAMMQLEGLRDMIMELDMDDDAKTSALTALNQVADDISMQESYQPFPEADEFNIEEDEDFEEVLGPLGFPETY